MPTPFGELAYFLECYQGTSKWHILCNSACVQPLLESLGHGFIVRYKDDNAIDQVHDLQRGSKQVIIKGEDIVIRGNYPQM